MNYIYGLSDPRTSELKYIGKTNNLKNRYNSHYGLDLRSKNYDKIHWIKELRDLKLRPDMFVIEETDNWEESEKFWISYFKYIGCNLLNKTNGGDSGPINLGEKNGFSKLTTIQVREIRKEYTETNISLLDLAEKYHVLQAAISKIITNKSYHDSNYIPKPRQNQNENLLSDSERLEIFNLYNDGYFTIHELCNKFRRSTNTIRKIIGNL